MNNSNLKIKLFLVLLQMLVVLCFCMGCKDNRSTSDSEISFEEPTEKRVEKEAEKNLVNPAGQIISTRFNVPPNYQRVEEEEGSFGAYLQSLALRPDGTPVFYHNGSQKPDGIHAAVVDMDIGEKDLQQCADAVMRLRGEYLFTNGFYDRIVFSFTNGFKADFETWSSGKRIRVKGNLCQWTAGGRQSKDYQNFRSYMEIVFAYAGTLSLDKELKPILPDELQVGDVFIKGGSPGHCVIVVDVAINTETGEKIFMIAQSYMPAQDIHILVNPTDKELSPWFKVDTSNDLETPQWTFSWDQLKRF